MAKFVAIIDANNYPVYFYSTENNDDVQSQFLAEMSLDFVDSQFIKTASTHSLLLVHDGVAVYGQMSNTNVKVFIGVSAHAAVELELDAIFKSIQDIYIRHICNPFFKSESRQIKSVSLDKKIAQLVA